jgi:hypothetical protein
MELTKHWNTCKAKLYIRMKNKVYLKGRRRRRKRRKARRRKEE